MSWKWTEGEVREALRRRDDDVLAEIVKYILERGANVIKRDDPSLGMYSDPPGEPDPEPAPVVISLDAHRRHK